MSVTETANPVFIRISLAHLCQDCRQAYQKSREIPPQGPRFNRAFPTKKEMWLLKEFPFITRQGADMVYWSGAPDLVVDPGTRDYDSALRNEIGHWVERLALHAAMSYKTYDGFAAMGRLMVHIIESMPRPLGHVERLFIERMMLYFSRGSLYRQLEKFIHHPEHDPPEWEKRID